MSWPPEGEPEFHGLCFLIMRRSGGLLLALPNGFLGADVLQGAAAGGGEGLVGPHTVMSVPGVVFDGDEMHGLGTELDVLVVDMAEPVLGALVPLQMCRWRRTSSLVFQKIWAIFRIQPGS